MDFDLLEEQLAQQASGKTVKAKDLLANGKPPAAAAAAAGAPRVKPFPELAEEEVAALPKPTYQQNVVKIRKPDLKKICDTQLPGDHYGILFPHSIELIESMGAPWLTQAFHIAGTLPKDNKVKRLKEVIGLSLDPTKGEAMGGAAVKVLLKVEYEKPHPDLHTELFVKIPHPYAPSNERHKISCVWFCDEPEIMFNRVLSTAVPIRVPKYYFGDISRQNTNCILICEALKFAKDFKEDLQPYDLWPATSKNKDMELPHKGRDYYFAMAKAHARFVAAYFTDALGDKFKLGEVFVNFNPGLAASQQRGMSVEPWGQDAWSYFEGVNATHMKQVAGMSAMGCDFALNVAPQLFPKEIANRKFLDRLRKELIHVAQYKGEIDHFSSSSYDCYSLSHINMNIDNAFYWLGEDGKLEAGFLDWGSFAHSNPIMSMTGNWLSGEADMFDEHEEQIVAHYLEELAKHGGPSVDMETAMFHAKLGQAGGALGHCGNLTQLYLLHKKQDPIWKSLKDRFDPRIHNVFLMRAFVNNWRNFLLMWHSKKRCPYTWFLKWLDKYKVCFGEKGPPLAADQSDY